MKTVSKPKHSKNNSDDRAKKSRRKPQAILRHRLYVPSKYVTDEDKEEYTDKIPDALPQFDEYGEEVLDRTLYVEGWKKHKSGYTSFCRGDVEKMYRVFGHRFEIVDETADVRLKHDLKFIGVPVGGEMLPLRPEQKKAIKEMRRKNHGIMRAPPRFGKTTVMTRLITKYKRRTIMFVHQVDLARQFEAEVRACTNINELERRAGRKLIAIVKKWKDMAGLEIAICTWQLLHHHPEAIKKNSDGFGMLLVDEGHRFSSQYSSKVISKFNTRYRIAVTATPERKDQRDVIFKQIVGPVTVVGATNQVPLRVRLVFTGFSPKFTRFLTYTKRNAESRMRNKMCLDTVEKEVGQGKSVLIVTTLRSHIEDLVKRLKNRGIAAESFYGGMKNRDDVLRRAKAGTTKVIVGMRSMLTGVNVPKWSSIHILQPTANAPNHYQEFSRVRTPIEGKDYATAHHYIDSCGAARGCYKTCHSNYVHPEYQPISFVDKNGNILKKTPSLKQINEWSQMYKKADYGPDFIDGDTDGDAGVGEGMRKGRKPVGFFGTKALWGKHSYANTRKAKQSK